MRRMTREQPRRSKELLWMMMMSRTRMRSKDAGAEERAQQGEQAKQCRAMRSEAKRCSAMQRTGRQCRALPRTAQHFKAMERHAQRRWRETSTRTPEKGTVHHNNVAPLFSTLWPPIDTPRKAPWTP